MKILSKLLVETQPIIGKIDKLITINSNQYPIPIDNNGYSYDEIYGEIIIEVQ